MKRKNVNGVGLWVFNNLQHERLIKHFITDRNADENTPFTLSLSSSPHKDQIENNRRRLSHALGIETNRLYFPSQVHKAKVVTVTSQTSKEDLKETDALITNQKGVCIVVLVADCVPILLYDTKHQAVAAVHSGWKGTVAKILEKTLAEMNRQFGTTGVDVIAGIGPSVCQESYEVGAEVVNQVVHAFGTESGLLLPVGNDKAKLDLWQANRQQLLDFGVNESRIEIGGLCTVKNNEHFFSARRGDAGRFGAGIVLV